MNDLPLRLLLPMQLVRNKSWPWFCSYCYCCCYCCYFSCGSATVDTGTVGWFPSLYPVSPTAAHLLPRCVGGTSREFNPSDQVLLLVPGTSTLNSNIWRFQQIILLITSPTPRHSAFAIVFRYYYLQLLQ